MTLIVAVNGRETIWLLADRRLSSKGGRRVRDDARKIMILETTDAVALLGYAGLGATALGTEPSEWMSAVLRGRKLPLEQSLGVLAEAIKKQIPRQLVQLGLAGLAGHDVVITALVEGRARLYTIDLLLSRDRKDYSFRYTRHVVSGSPKNQRAPRVGLAGSGTLILANDRSWIRPLLDMVKASDRAKVRPQAVADHLALLNFQVSSKMQDGTVGPRSIVVWRNRKEGIYRGGGGHSFYTESKRENSSPALPTIANGMDIEAIAGTLMPHTFKMMESLENGEPPPAFDEDEINSLLRNLPDTPDEELR